jgi:hypothetical protein
MSPVRLGALFAALTAVMGLAAVGRPAEPLTVTVRFMDARNGKPYTYNKDPVTIFFYRVDPGRGFNSQAEAKANQVGTVRQFPSADGEVKFTLPSPMPRVIQIPAVLTGCGPGSFDAQEVVEKGVVGRNECGTKSARKHVKFQARPGEIIYFKVEMVSGNGGQEMVSEEMVSGTILLSREKR